jgi:A/G-specific adenine glycosylase
MSASLAQRVVSWQRTHGRHALPWQNTRDPYRVWLSEIMLQQTQVSTVLEYYDRFLRRFADVAALAAASQEEVLGLWSGLGYYSRARNLHACAGQVVDLHGGVFPQSAELLVTLPGIGRSTAAAIASFCFNERVAILDGNVKRVLARALGFGEDLALAASERRLWDQATALLPLAASDMPAYTQGLMDLGATVCTTHSPACILCPLESTCQGRREGEPERYPVRTRKLKRRAETWWLLLATGPAGEVWLQQRPQTGIWAGLQCVPTFDSFEALVKAVGPGVLALQSLEPVLHVLTHRDLHLHPVLLHCADLQSLGLEGRWVPADGWASQGLAAPVRKLLTLHAA